MLRRNFMNLSAGAAAAACVRTIQPSLKLRNVKPQFHILIPPSRSLIPRFAKYKVGNAAVERLYTGTRWAEGPVWFADGRYLLFSDIPNNRMLRWLEETGEVSVFRSPSNYSNGNCRDRQGRLAHLRT